MVGIMVGMMVGMMVGLAPGLPSLSPFIYTGFRRSMVGMLGLLRKKYFLQYFVVSKLFSIFALSLVSP
jgi:hypothetical protein